MINRRKSISMTLKGFCLISIAGSGIFEWSGCNATDFPNVEDLNIFDINQLTSLGILADLIIPKSTYSPSATDVNAHYTIDSILHHFYNDNNKQQIIRGIQSVEQLSLNEHSKPLSECTSQEQHQVMQYLSDDGANSKNPKDHLFFILRELVVQAYFQSKFVREKVLRYDPIPRQYQGCITIDDKTKNWSL